MDGRPILNKNTPSKKFREYYYLKEDLVNFCRKEGLKTTGNKEELTERIEYYLATGKEKNTKIKAKSKKTNSMENINIKDKIGEEFTCTEKHRQFFKRQIGENFSFKVPFQKWLKSNGNKTYEGAVNQYYKILKENKKKKTTIDKQFEYNQYIRDFFENNKGKTLQEAITCWKYKKSLKGSNKYNSKDLIALKIKIELKKL